MKHMAEAHIRRNVGVLAVLAALALAGCGGSGGGDAADWPAVDPVETTSAHRLAAGPPAEPGCAEGVSAGRRHVLCTAGSAPDQGLIVALHGRGSSAGDMREGTALEHPAAAAGLSVVYAGSLDDGWGDDTSTSDGRPAGDEDVVYLDALVTELQRDPRIADGPVGVVGFSNGASMAMRYGAARPDNVVAVVAVAGQLPRDPAVHPAERVPLLLVYGTDDPIRPYDTGIPPTSDPAPGRPTPTLPTVDSVLAFAAAAGERTDEGPAVTTDADPGDGTHVLTQRWSDSQGTVAVLAAVVGGGHTWPSSPAAPPSTFGPVSRDLDASAEAVDFVVDPG